MSQKMGDETSHYLTNVALMTCQNISNNVRFTDCRQMRRMSKTKPSKMHGWVTCHLADAFSA